MNLKKILPFLYVYYRRGAPFVNEMKTPFLFSQCGSQTAACLQRIIIRIAVSLDRICSQRHAGLLQAGLPCFNPGSFIPCIGTENSNLLSLQLRQKLLKKRFKIVLIELFISAGRASQAILS